MDASENTEVEPEQESCVKGLSRKDFMKSLVKKSLAAGALFTAVSALDRFDIPVAYAATST